MRYLYWISLSLTIIGGINWGLIGGYNYNLVTHIITNQNTEKTIYILVGLAAIYLIYHCLYNCYHKIDL